MIQLSEEDLFQYLMNSDFHEEYSTEEYKFLMNKWRYYYRLLHGKYSRLKDDLDDKLKEVEKEKKDCESFSKECLGKALDAESKRKALLDRKLNWEERIKGKIIDSE